MLLNYVVNKNIWTKNAEMGKIGSIATMELCQMLSFIHARVTLLGTCGVFYKCFDICQEWNVFVDMPGHQRVKIISDDIVTIIETRFQKT